MEHSTEMPSFFCMVVPSDFLLLRNKPKSRLGTFEADRAGWIRVDWLQGVGGWEGGRGVPYISRPMEEGGKGTAQAHTVTGRQSATLVI